MSTLLGTLGARRASDRLRVVVLAVLVASAPMLASASQDPPALPSDPLFNSDVLQRVDLRMNSADWEKLKQNFQENTYYPADFVFNGQTVRNTGVRSRGFGSRSGTKPGLRVDFDRYTTDQSFLGLKSVVLDNLTQDPSAVHETVTMKMFARLGIPAPREAHARLYINNQYAGLYAIVESIDKQFLARVYGSIGDDVQNDGYLYEFNYVDPWTFTYLGSDLNAYETRFDPKTHESKSDAELYGPLENLVRLANTLSVDQYQATLGEQLDLGAFIRYVSGQNFMGQNDGFLGYAGMNNFYLYRLENSPKHVFLAWDEDNAFWGPEFPITMRHQENVLMSKTMQLAELRGLYNDALMEAARLAEEPTGADAIPWLENETRRQLDLLYDALREDTAKPYSIEEHEAARNAVIIFARDRSRSVRDQLANSGARRPQ
jgi:spore coat protein CotH